MGMIENVAQLTAMFYFEIVYICVLTDVDSLSTSHCCLHYTPNNRHIIK